MVSQIEFNIAVILDGLRALSAPKELQLKINKHFGEHVDDIFDPMPMIYVPYLITEGVITQSVGQLLKDLYDDIEVKFDSLHHSVQDRLIEMDDVSIIQLRARAKRVLQLFNACIESGKWTPPNV